MSTRGKISTREPFDVAIVGAGLSGMTAALLLANDGYRVALLEAHTTCGGCAGYFRRGDFFFDVGATTFISFQPGGVGQRLAQQVGLSDLPLAPIETYTLCLPDRRVPISSQHWARSWSESFPELGEGGVRFFESLGQQADRIWNLACQIPSLPLSRPRDLVRCLSAIRPSHIPSIPHFFTRFGEHLKPFSPLPEAMVGAFNMLLQDTTQNGIEQTPTAYALLGLTLMRHGLFRPRGSTRELWQRLTTNFTDSGGALLKKHPVERILRSGDGFEIEFSRKQLHPIKATRVISAIPVWNTHRLAPELFGAKLDPFLSRRRDLDGAFALYLGVRDFGLPQKALHYQVLGEIGAELSDGNNFLISLSGANESAAPAGFRSVTISCHSEPRQWETLPCEQRQLLGSRIVERFLSGAERLFPGFREAIVDEHFYPASPLTYARFTRRYRGMAGNQALTRSNSMWNAIPRYFGEENFLQIGDTGFPGAGTVACMVSGFNAYKDVKNHWF